jgi:uncharacterized surface protein with fasciclin (FAS1) repeats
LCGCCQQWGKVDFVCNDARLSILCTALQATELDAVLNQAGPFTEFAPTDDTFLALGQNTVAALSSTATTVAKSVPSTTNNSNK